MAMEVDELWNNFLKPRLECIEKKIDRANGRSTGNCVQIRGLWAVALAEAGLFAWWIKSLISGE